MRRGRVFYSLDLPLFLGFLLDAFKVVPLVLLLANVGPVMCRISPKSDCRIECDFDDEEPGAGRRLQTSVNRNRFHHDPNGLLGSNCTLIPSPP